MRYLLPLTIGLSLFTFSCATGDDKREGTTDNPQPAVGTTFDENDRLESGTTTGTAPTGDTAGFYTRRGVNDQVGPTGRGSDSDHPEAPAY